ncbi:MAG: cysteine desulfurase family protein [Novosphingobium sp.]
MMRETIYLDHAATTPLLPAAREAMERGFAIWANPSSPHRAGRTARAALEEARERVKAALGWQGEVVFTSGASEAIGLAIMRCVLPLAAVSAVEHEAVLRHTGDAKRLAVDGFGLVNPADCALPGLVAVQQANNETGVMQSISAITDAVRGAGGLLLCDAAQGAGKLLTPDADLIALSAHKFGGPVGVGALLVKDWAMLRPTGGQERGYRPGTENLPGVLAMAAALEADRGWLDRAVRLRNVLDEAIAAAGGTSIADDTARVPSIAAYRMPGVSANSQLIRFDAQGFAVSAGSACSSGSLRTSHVLEAMSIPNPNEVIRVSIGQETTEMHIDAFIAAWREVAAAQVRA